MSDNQLRRVLQVNIDDTGGAFALVYQVQKIIHNKIIFDYYTIDRFRHMDIIDDIKNMGGSIFEEHLRQNRLVGFFKTPFRFYSFLKTHQYEVVHIHSDKSWKLLLYALPAKVSKVKKIIVHSHSSGINGDYKLFAYVAHLLGRLIIPLLNLTYVSCSSEATKWMYVKRIRHRVYVIKNGVDLRRFSFSEKRRTKIREMIGVGENEVLIGTVGDFSYQKNPELLLNYFRHLYQKTSMYKLIFVGDGENKYKYMEMASEIGIRDRVIFYGRTLSTEELYDAMDIFTLTSRFEGLPVSAVEAQASGLKCVLSDVISKDTEILGDCEFFSNEKQWNRSVKNFKGNSIGRRAMCVQIVKDKGFDINYTSIQFMSLYTS